MFVSYFLTNTSDDPGIDETEKVLPSTVKLYEGRFVVSIEFWRFRTLVRHAQYPPVPPQGLVPEGLL